MIVSHNELEATMRKAFRGAGYHWGEAEEAGKAAVWLARRGFPVADACLALLTAASGELAALRPLVSGMKWTSGGREICPILSGIALADGTVRIEAGATIVLERLRDPILFVPFLSHAAHDSGFQLTLVTQDLEAMASGLSVDVTHSSGRASLPGIATLLVQESHQAASPYTGESRRPVEISPDCWNELNRFAARTYVPATDHSRIAGAGAGAGQDDRD